jgi:hypothetical protein
MAATWSAADFCGKAGAAARTSVAGYKRAASAPPVKTAALRNHSRRVYVPVLL